ncbi:PAAR domain-containing protein [Massilia sp. UMI-21]|nr:PAAR domain-containing protein [Massilia sp. UMI-21]
MSHKRYTIRDGARTTADGIVRASSSFTSLDGVALAREGDPVDCRACGEEGVIGCVMPRLFEQSEGKECALSEDLCICACSPPARLIADQSSDCQIVSDAQPA